MRSKVHAKSLPPCLWHCFRMNSCLLLSASGNLCFPSRVDKLLSHGRSYGEILWLILQPGSDKAQLVEHYLLQTPLQPCKGERNKPTP